MNSSSSFKTSFFLTGLLLVSSVLQGQPQVSKKDFNALKGNWSGELSYLDYSAGKTYTIKAGATVTLLKEGGFIMALNYPDEPDHNDSSIYRLNPGRTAINDMKIIEFSKEDKGNIKITLEKEGLDGNDNRPAIFHLVLLFSKASFKFTKMVRFKEESVFIQRNQYAFTR